MKIQSPNSKQISFIFKALTLADISILDTHDWKVSCFAHHTKVSDGIERNAAKAQSFARSSHSMALLSMAEPQSRLFPVPGLFVRSLGKSATHGATASTRHGCREPNQWPQQPECDGFWETTIATAGSSRSGVLCDYGSAASTTASFVNQWQV
jgi:hypothetical protein